MMAQHGRQYDPEDVVFERARQGATRGNSRNDAVLRTRQERQRHRAAPFIVAGVIIVAAAILAAILLLR